MENAKNVRYKMNIISNKRLTNAKNVLNNVKHVLMTVNSIVYFAKLL